MTLRGSAANAIVGYSPRPGSTDRERSGVGKSTVAYALHDLLASRDVKHALIEGDLLDLAYPPPWREQLAQRNLAAIWGNYRGLGYHRLIFTNTVSVLEIPTLTGALGCGVDVIAVLLRARDETILERLSRREHGASLERHLERSLAAATRLDHTAGNSVQRIDTDDLTPEAIAEQILKLSRWQPID